MSAALSADMLQSRAPAAHSQDKRQLCSRQPWLHIYLLLCLQCSIDIHLYQDQLRDPHQGTTTLAPHCSIICHQQSEWQHLMHAGQGLSPSYLQSHHSCWPSAA